MEFRTPKGKLLAIDEDRCVQLEESSTYHLAVQLGETAREGWRCWLNHLELEWKPSIPGFELRTSFWVGHADLRLQTPGGEQHFHLDVQPSTKKLSEAAWEVLLLELDSWLPGSTVGQEGGLHGSVGLVGSEAAAAAAVLGELVSLFESALAELMKAPRERSIEHLTEAPMHMVRQATRDTLKWLARHPDAYQCAQGRAEELRNGRAVLVPQRAWRGDFDHAANRHVAWLTRQVERRLREIAQRVERGAKQVKSLDEDMQRWCASRAARLLSGADTLAELLRRSALGELPPEPASESALLTLLDDPVYARVRRLGQIFLSPRFRLPIEGAQPSAPVRPSYELYELWTFFALKRFLSTHLSTAQWVESGLGTLRLFGEDPSSDVGFTAHLPGQGVLQLLFNPTFPGFLARKDSPRWSISKERRPDLVMAWKPAQGQPRWLCLDAKYRTEARFIAEAFESVHIYNDSLRWQGFGEKGRASGAVLLVPAQAKKAKPWFEKGFRDEHGVGAFQLTPGQAPPPELLEWIRERLGLSTS